MSQIPPPVPGPGGSYPPQSSNNMEYSRGPIQTPKTDRPSHPQSYLLAQSPYPSQMAPTQPPLTLSNVSHASPSLHGPNVRPGTQYTSYPASHSLNDIPHSQPMSGPPSIPSSSGLNSGHSHYESQSGLYSSAPQPHSSIQSHPPTSMHAQMPAGGSLPQQGHHNQIVSGSMPSSGTITPTHMQPHSSTAARPESPSTSQQSHTSAGVAGPPNTAFNFNEPNPSPAGYRPLNVRDALSYLDQVKIQFGDQPEVYNRFLDIMKDFKSQAIDTPGVIERVSSLFRGHPNLIMGFNTFLPPGYRIEPTNNPADPVRVTTPRDHPYVVNQIAPAASAGNDPYHPTNRGDSASRDGVSYGPPGSSIALSSLPSIAPGGPHPSAAYGLPMHNGAPPHMLHSGDSHMSAKHVPSNQGKDGFSNAPISGAVRYGAPHGSTQHLSGSGQPSQYSSASGPPPMQVYGDDNASSFGHDANARSNRGPVEFNHAINYVNKIKNRFSTEPDTYKQFLEILQTYQREGKPIQEVYAQVQILFKEAPDLLDEFKQFLPDNSQPQSQSFQQAQPQNQTHPQTPQQSSQHALSATENGIKSADQSAKKQAKRHSGTNFPMSYAGPPSQLPPPKKKIRTGNGIPSSSAMPLTSIAYRGKVASSGELDFFERCKRVIGNKASYNEFLKLLNLFTQEIIDSKTLVERTEPFLMRSPELFEWFKKFVKYENDEVIYNIPADRPEIDLRSCKRSGHSYRKLPKDIPRPATSGRDELAKEVLNNDWISHPVYVSETGFVVHKKTPYEEAMYKCEEERYEFDLNIESNLRVIAMLEPIAKQLQIMSPEERTKFRLSPGLGGYSVAIYQRAIKKVYDKDRGAEVIDALHQNPAIAVPIVLKRLKQKDEEWKRSQREWNKVWREIDAKNCAKALDHQGIHFKASDRKAMNVKSLVTEIEVLQREQCEKRSNLANRYQFDFAFKRLDIFRHVRRILASYIEPPSPASGPDDDRIREFLDVFVKRFFLIENLVGYDEDSENTPVSGNGFESAMAIDADSHGAYSGHVATPDACIPGSQTFKKTNDGTMMNTDGSIDVDVPMADTEMSMAGESECKLEHNTRKRTSYSFYANTNIYAFFRLYQMLFSRLQKMKELSDELDGLPTRSEMYNFIALELGLQKELGSGYSECDRYSELLKNIQAFSCNAMDAVDFEDRARNMFWTSGYLIFTVDRLISSIVKQMQLIISDPKSMDLISLFYRDHERPSTSSRQEAMYRLSAETLIQEENVYRLEFFIPERVLTVQLLGKNDQLSDDTISSEEKWSLYVDQFVQLSMAEALGFRRNEPFLKRTLPIEVTEDPPLYVETRSGLELKICVNTYKIFFVDNTEDYFRRKRSEMMAENGLTVSITTEKGIQSKRNAKFAAWLDGENGWRRGLTIEQCKNRLAAYQSWRGDKAILDKTANDFPNLTAASNGVNVTEVKSDTYLSTSVPNVVAMPSHTEPTPIKSPLSTAPVQSLTTSQKTVADAPTSINDDFGNVGKTHKDVVDAMEVEGM
ncbi:hypothetical protein QVD99_003749 [Batrachochytrium dendrobatidis]|nr:hypothetical protein O5D80_004061 [Batrachochytrium dendrobatidis]KAK5669353.1 hypothetical protein QVD99_003749 [Batrachochytrium dendrobatidis]